MILQGNFYSVLQPVMEPASLQVILKLNAHHPIFKGHFPGQPVVPGVCMLQIVKELVEMAVGGPVQLSKANELKFLTVIDPLQNDLINAEMNYSTDANGFTAVVARFFCGDTSFFKFKGVFNAPEPAFGP
jgi:3-hydroxyacyl-[acyl-carrier-protein] dehydratase